MTGCQSARKGDCFLKCGGQRAQWSDHTAAEGIQINVPSREVPNRTEPNQIEQTQGRGFPKVHRKRNARPYDQWEDGVALRQVRGLHSDDLSDVLWRDQNEEQVQNVFKRFLFHYSKARNSVGAVQHESHSVHPLMRLSPKLSQRRKKVLLLKI
ncbi:hypothetical protein INR49_026917 [Caranx melampygus]|nr:hypothetical protein INR49_026917 [Caranx melampygus]